jgi:HD-GYP domain-containing protein (c-di-GMP phosphodiesterase class II)
MELTPVKITTIRTDVALPFAIWDKEGRLLARSGSVIDDRRELQTLLRAREDVYIDVRDSDEHKRFHESRLMTMVMNDERIGKIAQTNSRASDLIQRAIVANTSESDSESDWIYVQEQAHAILRNGRDEGFLGQVDRLENRINRYSQANPDGALLALIQMAAVEVERYSATHSVLVSVLCGIAAREVLQWPASVHSILCQAALTMNIGMTELQDRLAQQTEPLAPLQRRNVSQHAERSVELLEKLGLQDQTWLEAVRHHHTMVPGPLAPRTPGARLARLIQRADMFAAAMSPRAGRRPVPPGKAMKAIYYDENHKVDEAGAALIKAVGIYSPGSYVQLNSEEVAIVVRRGANTTTPLAAVVISRNGMPHAELTVRDTAQPEFKVAASLPHDGVKVKPNLKRLLPLTLRHLPRR